MIFRCRHQWQVVDKTILPSAYEQVGVRLHTKIYDAEFFQGFFQKKVVVILACTCCGKLNKTVEVNPD